MAYRIPIRMRSIRGHKIDESDVALQEVLRRVGAKAVYTYDFGDNWQYEIVLEKRLPADPDTLYPMCTEGQRASPPEDCGGLGGFYHLLEAIRNPQHERHEESRRWLGEDYDPQKFSIEKVNGVLQGKRRGAG
jgi:hypothetical protein